MLHSEREVYGSVRLDRDMVGLKRAGDDSGVVFAVRRGIEADCGIGA